MTTGVNLTKKNSDNKTYPRNIFEKKDVTPIFYKFCERRTAEGLLLGGGSRRYRGGLVSN